MKLKPYKHIPQHKTDWLTYTVRFVCGAIFGMFAGGSLSIRMLRHDALEIAFEDKTTFSIEWIATVIGFTILFGFLAAIFGDQLWITFRRRY